MLHRHDDGVELPDGTVVRAVSFVADAPYARSAPPDFGLYLDPVWGPPWAHDHVDWPDFSVPADRDAALAALGDALDRARRGEVVEIGCLGGHGRTGTALAALVVLAGGDAADAVAEVRRRYCRHAVETEDQAAFVASLG